MAESQASLIRRFVQALDRDDRYIVMLYYADGLTAMEISRVLDLPSTRVRSRLQELRLQMTSVIQPRPAAATYGHESLGDAPAAFA